MVFSRNKVIFIKFQTSDAHHDPVNSLFRKAQRLNSLSRNQHPQKQPDAVVSSLLSLLGLSQQLSLKMNANGSAGIHKNQQERQQQNIYKCGICSYEQVWGFTLDFLKNYNFLNCRLPFHC